MTTAAEADFGRVVWHTLVTSDVEKAKDFYTQLFGWGIETFMPGEMDVPMIASGGAQHGGFMPLDPAMGAPSHWAAYVAVEDIDATVDRARGAGGMLVGEVFTVPTVGRIALIAGPDGAMISAMEPAVDMPTPEGVFVWDELTTPDTEGAKSYLKAVFGWDAHGVSMGGMQYTMFKREGGQDVAGAVSPPGGPPAAWLTYIGTADVDAAADKAVGLGGNVMVPGMDVGIGRMAILQDSTGAAFGVWKPAS